MNVSIEEVLTRGVSEILPTKKGLENLMKKKKIRAYLGIDPTGTKLHLGHSIPLRKLQQFADAGHEAILLFGTGTVLAGDPSQREKARRKITKNQIQENIATWKDQVKPIIDFKKVKIMYNADWLLKLSLADIIDMASHISAVQLFKREMFERRIKRGDTVWYHETMYPLLQGYDSVVMDVDLEIGGTDQTFNMLVGRELMQKMKRKEKYVLTTPMITGTDGEQMSKSSGNCIWLKDSPNDMFGKLMSINDNQIESYLFNLTDIAEQEIKEALKNPLLAKKTLASEIVRIYHGDSAADEAKEYFEKTFQKRKPDYSTKIPIDSNLAKTIAPFTPLKSISDAKRLIIQGSVDVNGKKVTDPTSTLKLGDQVRIGATTFGTIVEF